MGRGGDIPEGLEILDEAGEIIAAGAAPAVEAPDPAAADESRRRPRPLWIALGLVGLAGAALAAILLTADDTSTPEVTDPIGILDGPAITIDGATTGSFPVLGRRWQHDLVTVVDGEVVILDLNTGERRTIGEASPSFVPQVSVVDGEIYTSDFTDVRRITAGGSESVLEGDGSGFLIIGNFAQNQGEIFNGDPTLTHLSTGTEIQLDAVARYAPVGDHVFFERGGSIGVVDRSGDERPWAEGELLLTGDRAIAWRHCPAIDDCEYWSGTAEEPRMLRLDREAARAALMIGATTATGGTGFLGSVALLSPTGRHGWNVRVSSDFEDVDIQLVDLQTGDFVRWADSFSQPWWTPDEEVLLVSVGDSLVAIDTETGERQRIQGDLSGFGGGAIALLPRE